MILVLPLLCVWLSRNLIIKPKKSIIKSINTQEKAWYVSLSVVSRYVCSHILLHMSTLVYTIIQLPVSIASFKWYLHALTHAPAAELRRRSRITTVSGTLTNFVATLKYESENILGGVYLYTVYNWGPVRALEIQCVLEGSRWNMVFSGNHTVAFRFVLCNRNSIFDGICTHTHRCQMQKNTSNTGWKSDSGRCRKVRKEFDFLAYRTATLTPVPPITILDVHREDFF